MAVKERLEIRVDTDLAGALRDLSRESGISLNQLIGGICRWAVQHAHVGGVASDRGEIVTTDDAEVIWFGFDGVEDGPEDSELPAPAEVFFVLDYSAGRAVVNHKGYGR